MKGPLIFQYTRRRVVSAGDEACLWFRDSAKAAAEPANAAVLTHRGHVLVARPLLVRSSQNKNSRTNRTGTIFPSLAIVLFIYISSRNLLEDSNRSGTGTILAVVSYIRNLLSVRRMN